MKTGQTHASAYENLQLKVEILTQQLKTTEGENAVLRADVAYWKAKADQGRGRKAS